MNRVFSVIKIERSKCSFVRMKQYKDKVILNSHFFQEIEGLRVPAELSLSEEVEEGVRIYTSDLTFSTCDEIKYTGTKWAYRITLADGTRYIMGCSDRPFPVTSMSRTMGAVTSSQIPTYKVTMQNSQPLPIQD